MSAALINRSLTNIRTEFEFLYDSEVIDKALFDALVKALPQKYAKEMAPWGIEKLATAGQGPEPSTSKTQPADAKNTDSLSESMAKTSLQDNAPPPEEKPYPKGIAYCRASFNYDAIEAGDLSLKSGDLVVVLEHLSEDWWRGHKLSDSPAQAGVFPANYIQVLSESDFKANFEKDAQLYQRAPSAVAASSYQVYDTPPSYAPQPLYQPQQTQPTYGGHAQYPPPSTNYYQAPPQEEGSLHSSSNAHLKKIGGKFGNAAIFGAGATIGSNLVNLIF